MIRDILNALGVEVTREHKRYLMARCMSGRHPDNDPSWVIWTDGERRGEHHCWSCRWGGNLTKLVSHQLGIEWDKAQSWLKEAGWESSKVAISSVQLNIAPIRRFAFQLPRQIRFHDFEKWPNQYRDYWLGRGLTQDQAIRWGVGFAPIGTYWGRVVLVTRDQDGIPWNFAARSIYSDQKRYLYPSLEDGANHKILFGEEYWDGTQEDLFLTEGGLNAVAIDSVMPGVAVGAVGGSQVLPVHIAKICAFDRVFVVTDNDKAGDLAWRRVQNALGRLANILARIILPEGEDPVSIGPRLLKEICEEKRDDISRSLVRVAG